MVNNLYLNAVSESGYGLTPIRKAITSNKPNKPIHTTKNSKYSSTIMPTGYAVQNTTRCTETHPTGCLRIYG